MNLHSCLTHLAGESGTSTYARLRGVHKHPPLVERQRCHRQTKKCRPCAMPSALQIQKRSGSTRFADIVFQKGYDLRAEFRSAFVNALLAVLSSMCTAGFDLTLEDVKMFMAKLSDRPSPEGMGTTLHVERHCYLMTAILNGRFEAPRLFQVVRGVT